MASSPVQPSHPPEAPCPFLGFLLRGSALRSTFVPEGGEREYAKIQRPASRARRFSVGDKVLGQSEELDTDVCGLVLDREREMEEKSTCGGGQREEDGKKGGSR